MRRQFLVNFWGRSHWVDAANEAELRVYALQLATDRKTTVGYHEVVDGKPQLLGVVSGYVPAATEEAPQPRKTVPHDAPPQKVEQAPKKAPARYAERLSLLD